MTRRWTPVRLPHCDLRAGRGLSLTRTAGLLAGSDREGPHAPAQVLAITRYDGRSAISLAESVKAQHILPFIPNFVALAARLESLLGAPAGARTALESALPGPLGRGSLCPVHRAPGCAAC